MRVSKSLVRWMVAEGHAQPDESARGYKAVAAELLSSGTLAGTDYEALSIGSDEYTDDEPTGTKATDDDDTYRDDDFPDDDELIDDDFVSRGEVKSAIQSLGASVQKLRDEIQSPKGDDMIEKLFSGRSGAIRVKGADEAYSEKSYVAKNRYGQEVYNPAHQRPVRTMSDMEKAKAGVLFKKLFQRSGLGNVALSEHEQKLLDEMTLKDQWAGVVHDEYSADITGGRGVKSLIDDSLSGGIEINPIWFDEAVVSYPLLSGELYPCVEEIQVPRGRRIEGASIATPTANWGAFDATAIDLFNTASMVDAIDSSIHEITCAVPVGRNLMADSPIDIGAKITQLIGERFKQELDRVIAKGNAGTEPSGLFTTVGLTSLVTANGTAGPPALSDYVSLLFSIPKQYRSAMYGPAFVMNDTQYMRSRQIKIDPQNPTGDQRSVFSPLMEGSGAAVNSYSMLGWPVRICNDLANSQVGMFCMRRYRLYRRLAMSLQIVQDGATLARSNEVLIIARARFGGQFYDLNAGVKFTNPQS